MLENCVDMLDNRRVVAWRRQLGSDTCHVAFIHCGDTIGSIDRVK